MFIKIVSIIFVILICDINMAKRINFPVVDYSSTSRSKIEDINFIWTIKNASMLKKMQEHEPLESPLILIKGSDSIEFTLLIKPNYPTPYEDVMGVFLMYWNLEDFPMYIKYSIILMNKFYDILHDYTLSKEREFNPNAGYGNSHFMRKSVVYDPESNILLNDTLIMGVKISLFRKGVDSVKNVHIGNYNFTNNPPTKYFQPFIDNFKFSDLLLVINKTDMLPVHRLLLAAHSTVLSKVVQQVDQNPSDWTRYRKLHIEDVKFDVMKEVITYMYTNSEKIQILDEQILKNCTSCFIEWSKDLYKVGLKYKITRLNTFIEKYIFDNLNLHTAIDILIYMNELKANNVVFKIKKFIANQIFNFKDTIKFKNLKILYPRLARDILQIMVTNEGETWYTKDQY